MKWQEWLYIQCEIDAYASLLYMNINIETAEVMWVIALQNYTCLQVKVDISN